MLIKDLLKGSKVTLTSFKDFHLASLETWYNDIYFLRNFDMIPAFPRSAQELNSTLNNLRESQDKFMFAINSIEDKKIIGITGFENILWNNGAATIYIGIGEKNYRGCGIGMEALYLTMEFGFEELNLHRIQLTVISYNKPAIKLYEKLGFKKEGTYRQFIYRDGTRYDMYLYGILRSEWESTIKNKRRYHQ
ncbi:GNAT family N-acetyltransferase [Clostridium sp. WLY-B-L2]|uniref:GNAT family N-acetyltransferase n=1 Tax=Clostridium aromativorans TaxID=2836848 RepID=A0ABS8N933_9CLOT|nr:MULTISPECIES: GNAT family protein [Clostridium]MCC9296308.1 GNAT family N-acetyltransferase [Clostridium aromativorans]